jgi:uncharacterized protein
LPDLRSLLPHVLSQYVLDVRGIHGITHWARVLENGRRIVSPTGADPAVVALFALFHDACRRNEGHDPAHGPRAAELVRQMRGKIELDEAGITVLAEACRCHTDGPRPGADLTVLTCLDCDRLDIPRVGMRVRPSLLFTEAGRDPEVIRWATPRAVQRHVPELCRAEWGWDG